MLHISYWSSLSSGHGVTYSENQNFDEMFTASELDFIIVFSKHKYRNNCKHWQN